MSNGLSGDQLAEAVTAAYTYAYPLVLMGLTQSVSTNVRSPHQTMGEAPVNQFAYVRQFVPADSHVVVRPNNDTLYALAWLNLKPEPVVLSSGGTGDIYYMLPILDAWTNAAAAAPGSRTTGDGAGNYLLCGPGWSGDTPDGLTRIDIATNMAWIIGRIECHGKGGKNAATGGGDHYADVWKIQNNLHLVPLSAWTGDPADYQPPLHAVNPDINMTDSPPTQLAALTVPDCSKFFTSFCQLMTDNPANPADPVMADLLTQLGLTPDAQINWSASMSAADFATAQAAAADALANIDVMPPEQTVNQWNMLIDPRVADFGRDYPFRAVMAAKGLGANLLVDAVYPTCFNVMASDGGDGGTPNGDNVYTLTFAADQTPPAKGFWSVTAYDADGYFIPNPLNRQAVHNWDTQLAADGSLTITLRAVSDDEGDPGPNVLPVAAGAVFNLTMRIYWPEAAVLDGSWSPPGLTLAS